VKHSFLERIGHYIRGARGSKYTWESPVHFGGRVRIGSRVHIGRFTYITSGRIYPNVLIGRFCSMAINVVIGAQDHPTDWLSCSTFQYENRDRFRTFHTPLPWREAPQTRIGNDVWIGANAVIKGGVAIGDGAIIGAGAVVTRDIPPYAVAVGVPARVIKYRFDEETIRELLELQWWNAEPAVLMDLPYHDIRQCIAEIRRRMRSN